MATSYNNVGCTLGELGRHDEALVHQQKALEMRLAIFGEKHPDVATSYNNLGGTLGKLGKHDEALVHKQKALEMFIAIFGEKHPDVAISYNNVGQTLLILEEHHSAITHLIKALHIHQGNPLYQLHPNIINTHNALSHCYSALKNKEKQLHHMHESQKISKELENRAIFQKSQPPLIEFLQLGEYQKAYAFFIKLPKSLRDAPQFICTHLQLMLLCPDFKISLIEKQIQLAETSLKNQKISIPTRLKLYINLANYCLNQNKWDKAYEYVQQLNSLLEIAPTLCFKYELLDLLPFRENRLIEGECIPAEVLKQFIALKYYQGKGNFKILPIIAKQLLEKIKGLETQGHKTEEMKNACLQCLTDKP